MLRTVKIKNFIHFADEHTLQFETGSNFFIGENHTGKTSLFEAVRRCMSVSKSNGLSGAHDPDKLSYVTCVFVTDDTTVKSYMIRLPGTGLRDVDHGFLKMVQNSNNNTIHADLVKKNSEGKLVCKQLPDDILQDISLLLAGDNFHAEVASMLGERKKLPFLRKNFVGNYTETECEKLLKSTVDQYTIIMFSFRSISPFESTVTETKPKKRRQQIAIQVSGKADILNWYLRNYKDIPVTQKNREKRFFNMITDNSGFHFDIDDAGVISVTNSKMRKRKLDSAALLLKIPEGIYEAKILAVLLTVQNFTTVCLDDAERGMHPQMIERIRDHVLTEVKDKVVLLITHHPSYLARWNISRLFLFQRAEKGDKDSFQIRSLNILFGGHDQVQEVVQGSSKPTHCEEMEEKTLQLIGGHNVASLFFARRILLVEGKSDELFITAFVHVLTHGNNILGEYLPKESSKAIKELKYFISGFHIVPMHGAPNVYKFHSLCQTLGLHHFMILDYDVMFENLGGKDGKTKQEKFCNKLDLSNATKQCTNLTQNVEILETDNIFMWNPRDKNDYKSGKIEDAVQTIFDKNPKEKYFLKGCLIKSKQKKLLLDKNVKYENIQDVANKCAELTKQDSSSDLNRLVRFFLKKSKGKQTIKPLP